MSTRSGDATEKQPHQGADPGRAPARKKAAIKTGARRARAKATTAEEKARRAIEHTVSDATEAVLDAFDGVIASIDNLTKREK